jgi:hypothetical protein
MLHAVPVTMAAMNTKSSNSPHFLGGELPWPLVMMTMMARVLAIRLIKGVCLPDDKSYVE